MDSILTFAQHSTPIMIALVIIAGLVHIVILLLKNLGVIKKVSAVQDEKYLTIEQNTEILKRLDKIANNHLHELPDMRQDVREIKETLNASILSNEKRFTRLETIIEK